MTIEGFRMNEANLEKKLAEEKRNQRYEVQDTREKDKRIYHLEQEVKSINVVVDIMKSTANTQL